MSKLITSILSLFLITNIMAAEHMVSIENFAFNPATLEVAVGDTVIFTNNDRAPHNVVPRELSPVQFLSSPILNTGDSFTLEISEEDQILAHCGVHPRMPGIELNIISERQLLLNKIRSDLDKLDKMID